MRPHKEIVMSVTSETGNKYDPHALVVTITQLENIPIELHNAVTREQSRGRHEQNVQDMAGKVVGRVPANLCIKKSFWQKTHSW